MAPLPKRKFSTRRTGKRVTSKAKSLARLVDCKKCGKTKLPHKICKYCLK